MSVFDNGQVEDLLSDEVLFADEGEFTDVEPISEDVRPTELAAADGGSKVTELSAGEMAELRRQNEAAQARAAANAQALAAERLHRQQLEQALAVAGSNDPAQKERFNQLLAENPRAALSEVANQTAGQVAADKVKELLQPIIEAGQRQNREKAWQDACRDAKSIWPELGSRSRELIPRMVEISAGYGDRDLWMKQPAGIMRLAAMELLGMPRAVDNAAISAASAAGRDNALRELNEKRQGKAGLAAATGLRVADQVMTEDEQIFAEMVASRGGGVFK